MARGAESATETPKFSKMTRLFRYVGPFTGFFGIITA